MTEPNQITPKFNQIEGKAMLEGFERRALLDVASSNHTIPYYARAKLMRDFKAALLHTGLPAEFYYVLKRHDGVISGSFVPFFLKHNKDEGWDGAGSEVHDVDVYVGSGKALEFVESLRNMNGVNLSTCFVVHPSNVENDNNEAAAVNVEDGPFYNNPGISMMARITLVHGEDYSCKLDIVESRSASPLLPIMFFELSHVRLGISAEAIIDLHPQWHDPSEKVTFVSPRVMQYAKSTNTLHPHTQRLIDKYTRRGYRVFGPTTSIEAPGDLNHYCYASPSCPLTMRSTTDEGVLYVPFTEEAAMRALSNKPRILCQPIVKWCHGGRCALNGNHEIVEARAYEL